MTIRNYRNLPLHYCNMQTVELIEVTMFSYLHAWKYKITNITLTLITETCL